MPLNRGALFWDSKGVVLSESSGKTCFTRIEYTVSTLTLLKRLFFDITFKLEKQKMLWQKRGSLNRKTKV